ncbi:MAG: 50S ribosomal protein L29 [Acidimicrobiales bacterium]|nr:50S ribosomal protein L29 [Acidimicrobiales bacterium]MBO0893729.1 50S ribosomal protein L29 [Acidimicrobiales bacterium]
MTSPNDLRILDTDELESRLAETQQELFNLRFQRVTGQLDNTARLRELRREVARMKTIAREREIAEAEGEEAAGLAPARAPEQAPARRARLSASAVAAAEPSPLPVPERVEAGGAEQPADEDGVDEGGADEDVADEDGASPSEDDEPEEAP